MDSGRSSQEIVERSDQDCPSGLSVILRLVIDLTRNDKKQDDTYMNQSVSRVIFTCYIQNFQLLVPRYVLLLYRTGLYKESRALFLRTRNGTPELYEEFATRILNSTRVHPQKDWRSY